MKLSAPRSPRHRPWLALPLLALLSLTSGALAQAEPSRQVPELLKPWIPWVLAGVTAEQCSQVNEVRTCVFPSALSLQAGRSAGSFSLRVTSEREGPISLPGSTEHFPLEVKEGKRQIPVLDVDGTPTVYLPAGSYTLTGSFRFNGVPDSLQLPPNLATLELSVEGTRLAFPKREASGLVWLKQSGDGAEEERLSLSVHRRLEDGVPVRLTTRIHVSASGKAREVVLPSVLVAGTRPIELRTSLPAELTAEGTLRTQIQAGEHDLEIVAIRETEAPSFAAPSAAEPWPERELWVLKTDERLRHVEVQGPAQIDPARTDLAPDWRGLPTYVMPAKQTLNLETRRRGEPEPSPNQLSLQRSLWLDLDGDGYTVRDQLSGKLHRNFRLDLLAAPLGHAVDQGNDQLITRHAKQTGVELRQQSVRLQTEWRLEHGQSDLPAVGYNEDVDSLHMELRLPPGFMLLGATGVDQLPGTWLDSWDLFDFFFVLLVSLAVAKVAGKPFGVAALIALVLTHHEPEAPSVAWVSLLAMTALQFAFERERFARAVRVGWGFALIAVLLVLLPFAVMQVRKALYPHLDYTGSGMLDSHSLSMSAEPTRTPEPQLTAPEEAPSPVPEMARERAEKELLGSLSNEGGGALGDALAGGSVSKDAGGFLGEKADRGRAANSSSLAYKVEVDPSAVVQTGPGLPTWQFHSYQLSWSGPVQKDQRIKLLIAPPLVTRAWSLLSVLFSGLLLFALTRAFQRTTSASNGPTVSPPPGPPVDSGSGTIATLLALLALGAATTAHAQALPSPELLSELKQRLLEPAECEPDCLSVASLALRIEGARLTLRAEVHAQAPASYQVPGPLESWAPESVRIDGKDALAAVRHGDGFVYLRVPVGVHQVELAGPVPRSQAFTLALGTPPHHVSAEHKGYLIDGLRDDGRAEGSLSLRREVDHPAEDQEAAQGLVQWFEVRRELDLGIRFRIQTTVSRLGPATESALLRVPLLDGEAVNEADLVSDASGVIVELPRGESTRSFSSGMSPKPQLKLTAATPAGSGSNIARPISEVWVVAPSVLYRPRFEGIAPIALVSAAGTFQPEYRPFPGESLTIHAERLSGAEGDSVTTDRADATFTPGSRMEQATLQLSVRTSRGSTEHVTIPNDALLSGVQVDGTQRPARVKEGKLEVHLDPGSHRIALTLQRPVGMGFSYQPMHLATGRQLTNVTSEVRVPDGRWLLWARGPAWGPAVLFWGYLLVVLLFAVALGRLGLSPLKTHQWCLLGLGLTQVEAAVALIVVGWLFALAYRERHQFENRAVFNATQVLLVALSALALVCLGYAVHRGLVVQPSMQVEGMGSTDQLLRWYADRTGGAFPDTSIWSAPLWTYKALMLLWALWLAASIIHWLRWGFAALRTGGGYRPRVRKGNPQVNLADIEAAESQLKRSDLQGNRPSAPPGEGGREGAGVP